MSDHLTDEEQKLIEAAIADGKVTRIARGRSAWETREGHHLTPEMHPTVRMKVEHVIARRERLRYLMEIEGVDEDTAVFQVCDECSINWSSVAQDGRMVRHSLATSSLVRRFGRSGPFPGSEPLQRPPWASGNASKEKHNGHRSRVKRRTLLEQREARA